MTMQSPFARTAALAGLVALAGSSVACGHVNQEQFDAGVVQLRGEIRQGDEDVARRLGTRIDGVETRVGELESDLAALEQEFDMTVERLESALRFNAPVYFGFDEATLRPEDQELLARFSGIVQQYYPNALVTVEGFTDPAGGAEYNRRLGLKRAEAVRDFLVAQGELSGDRIRAVSYGEDQARQVALDRSGPGPDGWENRRVVLVIDHGDAASRADVVASELRR